MLGFKLYKYLWWVAEAAKGSIFSTFFGFMWLKQRSFRSDSYSDCWTLSFCKVGSSDCVGERLNIDWLIEWAGFRGTGFNVLLLNSKSVEAFRINMLLDSPATSSVR